MDLSRFRRPRHTAQTYFEGIRAGDRNLLSQAITLLESTLPQDQHLGQEVLALCLPYTGESFRLGITGTPGVGKSSFIEAFGQHCLAQGHRLAVLAIDPSSQVSKGSILGDKTRMQNLANQAEAFIRPSPSGQTLGGVARKTRETILLCEAAGYDWIFIETVGVGQSETAVRWLSDFFLLLLLPSAGDELQGIKRGIMEMADWIGINKADLHPQAAKLAVAQCNNALHLFPAKESGWIAQAQPISAHSGLGLSDLWQTLREYARMSQANGYWARHRAAQQQYWFEEALRAGLQTWFDQLPWTQAQLPGLRRAVESGELSPFRAAELLLAQLAELGSLG
jgi:LAO/AO transport system kinase